MTDLRKDLPPVNSPNFLEKVREALSVYLGNRGDALDQGLTRRDLLDAGVIGSAINGKVTAVVSEATGGYGAAIAAVKKEPDLTPPPTPTNFTATAGIFNLMVECDYPTYTVGHGHSKSILYGAKWESGPLPVFTKSVPLTEFAGSVFAYPTDPATTWHLWLKWKTVDDVESYAPAGGINGVVVTTGQDPAKLLEVLTASITASQLFTDLGERIDLIDVGPTALTSKVAGLETTYGSTASAAVSAANAASAASTATQAKVDAITAQGGAANSATTASTKATEASTSATNAAGSASSAATSATTASTAATNAGNSSSAAATSATNAATYATNSETSSTASTAAKVAAQSAQSAALGSANAASGSASTATTKATEASTSATSASTSATTATTKAADAAVSATNAATSETNAAGSASSASTSAGVATTAKNNANDSATAAATSASTASTKASDAGTASTAATAAKVAAESAQSGAATSATAAATSASTASTKATEAGTSATAAAASATTASTKAGEASTYASNAASSASTAAGSASTASTQAGIATTAKNAAGDSAAAALVSQNAAAQSATNADGSAASASSTLGSINAVVAGAASAAVSTESSARITDDNKLFAQYTVKVDTNGYVSGFGLASTLKDATPYSEFAIRADKFYIANPSGPGASAPVVPFTVVTTAIGTPGTAGYIPVGVYMNGGVIKKATIDGAAIVGGTIEKTKLMGDISFTDLQGGSLTASRWVGSPDYATSGGTTGWRLNADGTAYLQNAIVRGEVHATSGTFTGMLNAVTMNSGSINLQGDGGTSWGYARSLSKWWGDASNGWVFAREGGTGDTFAEMKAGTSRFWMSSWGDCGLRMGANPAVSGSTMTGTGIYMDHGGAFCAGNASRNISFNGYTLTMNGDVVVTGNIVNNAVTQPLSIAFGNGTHYATNGVANLNYGDTTTALVAVAGGNTAYIDMDAGFLPVVFTMMCSTEAGIAPSTTACNPRCVAKLFNSAGVYVSTIFDIYTSLDSNWTQTFVASGTAVITTPGVYFIKFYIGNAWSTGDWLLARPAVATIWGIRR